MTDVVTPTLNSPAQRKGWEFASADPAGASLKAIADHAGVSTGTASGWLRKWRAELGDDLFRTERAAAAAEQTAVARETAEATWLELREREARNLGVTASQIRARALELLPTVATVRVDRGSDGQSAPVVVHGPDARQVKALADATARLLETAELISGNPTRHTRRSVPSDQWQGAGAGPELTDEQRRAGVIDLAERIRQTKRAAEATG